jgi:hypothetical protein
MGCSKADRRFWRKARFDGGYEEHERVLRDGRQIAERRRDRDLTTMYYCFCELGPVVTDRPKPLELAFGGLRRGAVAS